MSDELLGQNSALLDEVKEWRETYAALQNDHDAAEAELEQLKAALKSKEAQYSQLESQAELGNGELQDQLNELGTANAELKQTIADFERQHAEFKQVLSDRAAMESKSEAKRNQLAKQVEQLRKEVQAKTAQCEQEEAAYRQDNDLLGAQLDEAEAAKAAAKEEVKELRSLYNEKEAETTAAVQSYNDIVTQTAVLQQQLKDTTDELNATQASNEELERLRAAYEELRALREQDQANISQGLKQVKTANKTLNSTLQKYAKIHAERDEYKDWVDANLLKPVGGKFETLHFEKDGNGSYTAFFDAEE
jgi:chromosome segregation ATPase